MIFKWPSNIINIASLILIITIEFRTTLSACNGFSCGIRKLPWLRQHKHTPNMSKLLILYSMITAFLRGSKMNKYVIYVLKSLTVSLYKEVGNYCTMQQTVKLLLFFKFLCIFLLVLVFLIYRPVIGLDRC